MSAVHRSEFGFGAARDGLTFDEWLTKEKAKNPFAHQVPWWMRLGATPTSQDRKD